MCSTFILSRIIIYWVASFGFWQFLLHTLHVAWNHLSILTCCEQKQNVVFGSSPSCLLLGQLNYLGASHQVWHVLVVVMFYWWHQTAVHIMHFRHSQACPKQTSSSWVQLIWGQAAAGLLLFVDITLTLYIITQRPFNTWEEVAASRSASPDILLAANVKMRVAVCVTEPSVTVCIVSTSPSVEQL